MSDEFKWSMVQPYVQVASRTFPYLAAWYTTFMQRYLGVERYASALLLKALLLFQC